MSEVKQINNIFNDKAMRLFLILGGIFVTNAIVAEFVGVKIFAFESTLGVDPLNWNLFGQKGTLDLSAGVILWPVIFIMTDIINEYYGVRGVKFLSYMGAALIAYAFLMVFMTIGLEPASWWIGTAKEKGIDDYQKAFSVVFGQGNWIIVGSLIAFLLGQIIDAYVFRKIKKATGGKMVWLRANGSTMISQFIDSFVVLYIAFVLGPPKWSMGLFLAVGTVNYCYKFLSAIVLTPLIYLAHALIDRYLGETKAAEMKALAATGK